MPPESHFQSCRWHHLSIDFVKCKTFGLNHVAFLIGDTGQVDSSFGLIPSFDDLLKFFLWFSVERIWSVERWLRI